MRRATKQTNSYTLLLCNLPRLSLLSMKYPAFMILIQCFEAISHDFHLCCECTPHVQARVTGRAFEPEEPVWSTSLRKADKQQRNSPFLPVHVLITKVWLVFNVPWSMPVKSLHYRHSPDFTISAAFRRAGCQEVYNQSANRKRCTRAQHKN